jgi:P4 family phage/plasmid primase-like protien
MAQDVKGMINLKDCTSNGELKNSKIEDDKLVKAFVATGYVCNNGHDKILIFDNQFKYWRAFSKKDCNGPLRQLIFEDQRFVLPYARIVKIADLLLATKELQLDFDNERNATQVHVLNGVVDLNTGKLREFDPTMDSFNYVLQIEYHEQVDQEKDFPNFKKFLLTSIQAKKFPDNALLLRQMLGVMVTDLKGVKKAFFWIGRSNAGKSMLVKLLRAVVENSTSVSLHELGDRFRLALLRSSRLNVADEIRQVPVQALDNFKKIVSNDMIVIEEKGRPPENSTINAKLLFVGNSLPGLTEANCEAVLNRMSLLFFDTSIQNNMWIPDLDQKIIAEKDAIFSWALQAVAPLIANKFQFAKPKPSEAYMRDYRDEVTSVQTFLTESCEFGDYAANKELRCHLADIRQAYHEFCDLNCLREQSFTTLKEQLASHQGVVPGKFRIGNSRPLHGYQGVRLKPKAVEEDEPEDYKKAEDKKIKHIKMPQ